MLTKSHSEVSKKNRKAKSYVTSQGTTAKSKIYNKADNLIGIVYADIAKGLSRSDVLKKLMSGSYEGMEQPLKERQARYYYKTALDRFAVDTDIEAEKLRDMFYGRYEKILAECMKKGDLFNARATLDSMSKIFLGIDQKPTTAIQINGDKEGGVTVNFGFSNNNKEIED